ncbi:hypothetical protein FM107_03635 [Sphingobacterium sp. JB170]|nr:hypothetical protein FM107_03635 [Sphingobacterium sp. JB170]
MDVVLSFFFGVLFLIVFILVLEQWTKEQITEMKENCGS